MNRLDPMKTIALNGNVKNVTLRLADFYPLAGIVGIATYVFVKSFAG
jgi:hypothetical protein